MEDPVSVNASHGGSYSVFGLNSEAARASSSEADNAVHPSKVCLLHTNMGQDITWYHQNVGILILRILSPAVWPVLVLLLQRGFQNYRLLEKV